MLAPKSDAALLRFNEFCSAIRKRLESGRDTYGDVSFERPASELIHEILQEVLDQAGWSFIAYIRLVELEEKMRKADALR